jgi:LCP family protein required for cell wall assembly
VNSTPSPALAAFLSFLFPGLGQIYAGRTRRGIVWAIPMLVVVVAAALVLLGGSRSLTTFLTAERALELLVLDLALFVYHVAAMVDAYLVARRGPVTARSGIVALAALIVLAVALHAVPGAFGLAYYGFASSFKGDTDVIVAASFAAQTIAPATPTPVGTASTAPSFRATRTPYASGSPAATDEVPNTAAPSASPVPGASVKPKACPPAPDLASWAPGADGRVNILLVGSDSRSDDGVSGASLRTDSMMLLSVDVADCKAALFSFPRNLAEVTDPLSGSRYPAWFHIPLENGEDFPGYLFGLWRTAAERPGQFPGSDGIGSECQTQFSCERGWRALTYAIQQMSGVNVDGVIAVNLKGFVDIVGNLPGSGVWLDIPEPLHDDAYFNSKQQLYPVDFKPGCQFLGPEDTLAYSRSRHQDSDYQRARRQQFVLQSIRRQLDPLAVLPHIPGLLNAAQQNLFMTFSSDDFPYLAQVASRVDADRLYQYDFAPARLTPLGSMAGMQAKVQNIFSEPEPAAEPQQHESSCPPP